MEQGYGGPVWHASIAPHRITIPEFELKRLAYQALAKVGDAQLGQWLEVGDRAVHVRRRLSDRELAELLPAHRELVDVRDWDAEQLTHLVRPVLEAEPNLQRREWMATMIAQEVAAA